MRGWRRKTLNISKLEYLWAFRRKIQNWNFLGINLKNWGLRTKNTKTNLKYLKIKVF